ncbi:PTS system, N-acetylglucosamine-specific IIA component [Promicromonospora umidemergens]|uniref:PTS glucose transporter subunit IIA n=1 Tax=Promicromonospora umidemergens TaxID=629679 RepID=A0ABP8WPK3_9MICO|nr:PTS glucose transporter subunit IIA [Promicromonospora umidemergens]MCP2285807.1 PTS system, N-acetylglucosamine-specific IIA component [Promicromonospora umidemergens]
MAEALIVGSPVVGRVVAMRDVPDPVFAESIVGPGLAIDPDPELGGRVVAPCAGVVVKLHPHAFVLLVPPVDQPGPDASRERGRGLDLAALGDPAASPPPAGGRGVLVHLGIDTVQLKGQGFTLLVAEGATVTAGQALIAWSPTEVSDGGRSPLVPVVALDLAPLGLEELARPGTLVQAGDPLFHLA